MATATALHIRRTRHAALCRVGTVCTPGGFADLDVTRVRPTPAYPDGFAVQVTDAGEMTAEWKQPVAYAAELDATHPKIAAAIRAALTLDWSRR